MVDFVEKMGFEPTTSCMPCKRSSQLSYIPSLWRANIVIFTYAIQLLLKPITEFYFQSLIFLSCSLPTAL